MSGLNQLIRKLDKSVSAKKDKRNSFSPKPRVEGSNSITPPPKDAPKFAVKPEVWIELHPPEQSSNHSTPCSTSPVSDSLVNPCVHTSTPLSQQCNPAMYSFGTSSNVSDIIDQDSLSIDSPVSSPLALFE